MVHLSFSKKKSSYYVILSLLTFSSKWSTHLVPGYKKNFHPLEGGPRTETGFKNLVATPPDIWVL